MPRGMETQVVLPSHWCSKKLCLPSWYESPVEKDFPRSGVTPPPSLTRRGLPLGAPDTCPQRYSPLWSLCDRGCDPVSPLDPPDYGPPCGPRTEVFYPSSPPKGSLGGPTSHGNPLFSHYSAPHALRKMFSLVLDPPVFDSGRCPFHFFDLEKKN